MCPNILREGGHAYLDDESVCQTYFEKVVYLFGRFEGLLKNVQNVINSSHVRGIGSLVPILQPPPPKKKQTKKTGHRCVPILYSS